MNVGSYNALASLLAYPGGDYRQQLALAIEVVPPNAGADVVRFAAEIGGLSTEQLQELFTQTFDLSPLCSLELGWHLFGENYERGLLLVRMRDELRRAGIAESTELPDHLTHALMLLASMDHMRAADFAAAVVLPALMKMLDAVKAQTTPYNHLLRALAGSLHQDFPEIPLPTTRVELPVLPHEVTA